MKGMKSTVKNNFVFILDDFWGKIAHNGVAAWRCATLGAYSQTAC